MNHDPTENSNLRPDDLNDIPVVDDDQREYLGDNYDAREIIASALYEETYFDYALSTTPIAEADVYYEIRDSENFQYVKEKFGWPNFKDDGGIEPPHSYGAEGEPDYEEFKKAFVSKADDPAANLHNFRMWLIAEPNDIPLDDASFLDQYGSHPALKRLYVLMPELMGAVHQLVKDAYERDKSGEADFASEMMLGKNNELNMVIYLVYQIAGRVLKADDKRRHYALITGEDNPAASKIVDAHQTLQA